MDSMRSVDETWSFRAMSRQSSVLLSQLRVWASFYMCTQKNTSRMNEHWHSSVFECVCVCVYTRRDRWWSMSHDSGARHQLAHRRSVSSCPTPQSFTPTFLSPLFPLFLHLSGVHVSGLEGSDTWQGWTRIRDVPRGGSGSGGRWKTRGEGYCIYSPPSWDLIKMKLADPLFINTHIQIHIKAKHQRWRGISFSSSIMNPCMIQEVTYSTTISTLSLDFKAHLL